MSGAAIRDRIERAKRILVDADEMVRAAQGSAEQLDDNVGALDVKLTAEHVAALDKAITPTLPFPVDMLSAVPAFAYGGTTINGQPSKAWPQAPQTDSERF